MQVYARTFLSGMQSALIYRWNFAMRVVFGFVPLIGTFFFWNAVFKGQENFGSYTFASMMTYFAFIMVLDAFTASADDDFQIASDIRDGLINQMLLKPVDYWSYRFSLFAAARAVGAATALLPLAVMIWFLWPFLELPRDPAIWAWTAVAFAGAAILQFQVSFCTGMVAFWMLDIGGLVFLLFGLEYLAGGHVFPLDLLPEPMFSAAMSLPFAYMYFFPMMVATGKALGPELWQGLAMQWVWIGVLAIVGRVLWAAGLRRYSAVGG